MDNVTREQATAIADLIKEQMDATYAKLLEARKPDPRVVQGSRDAHDLRRSARRLRSGQFRPKWATTESPEELALEFDYAAEYDDLMVSVRRLAKTHKNVELHIVNETFAEVRDAFHQMKEWLRNPELDEVTAENIVALHRERRRDLGRPKKSGPKVGEGGVPKRAVP
jgi:uncharacterized membrane protein YdfJ with MMPL/SSD domain